MREFSHFRLIYFSGGQAFQFYHQNMSTIPQTQSRQSIVHIDVYAAQTGVSRFGQILNQKIFHENQNQIIYDKTEDLAEFNKFDHLIMENNSTKIDRLKKVFQVAKEIDSYAGISVDYSKFPPLVIKSRPSIVIMEKKESSTK